MKKYFIIFLFPMTLSGNSGHKCPFELCPYKNYHSFPGVIHTGETAVDPEMEGSDTWCIDQLHFDYPAKSYDELEDLIWK